MTSKLNLLAAMTTTTAPTDDEYQRQRLDSCIQIEEMEDVVYSLQEDTKRRPITISKSNGNLLAQPLSKLTSNKMQSVRDKTSQMNENVDYMDADFADDNVSNDALTFDRHLRHSTTSTFHPNRAFTMAFHQKDQEAAVSHQDNNTPTNKGAKPFYELSFNNSQHFLLNNLCQNEQEDNVSQHSKVSIDRQKPSTPAAKTFMGFSLGSNLEQPLLHGDDQEVAFTGMPLNNSDQQLIATEAQPETKSPQKTGGFYWHQFRKRQKQLTSNEKRISKQTPFFTADQKSDYSSDGTKSLCKCNLGNILFLFFVGICFGLVVQYLVKNGVETQEESVTAMTETIQGVAEMADAQ